MRGARARVIAALAVLAISAPAWSQSRTVSIDRDLRLFTMMAAINTAGFDVELGGDGYHSVRKEMRKIAGELDPAFVARLRQFYATQKGAQSDELQLPKYVGLALALSGPPDFSLTVREEFLPPDARSVLRFAENLKEFYVKARIPERWVLARPFYDSEAERLGPPVRDAMRRTDAYLRATTGTAKPRQMALHVELAAPKNTVNVQSIQNEYHVVLGGSAEPRVADVRHAYLHMSIDSDLLGKMNVISGAQSLLALAAKEEGVSAEYMTDLFGMTRESLVRAIELRLDRPPAAQATSLANGYYRSGLLLVPFFQAALPAYEQDETGLVAYLPTMLATLKVKDEQKRFEETFRKIPAPAPKKQITETRAAEPSALLPPPEPLNPMRAALVEATSAFTSGDTGKARALFERVLETFEPDNATALYGLALVAGKEGDDKAARKYFERTLESPSAEPATRVWTHVYLGRLDDLACERASAIEHYREAIKIGDDSRNAQAIAKEGVARSFNDACGKP